MSSSEREPGLLKKKEMERLINLSECAMFAAFHGSDIELKYANKKFYSIIQYSPEEFKERFQNKLMDLILPEEKQKMRALISRQSAAGGLIHLEFRIKRKNGSIYWISMIAQSAMEDDEMMYYGSCTNITQQKRNYTEIYNAKREVDLITNSIPGGVIKVRMKDMVILYSNDGFYRLSGYSRMEFLSLFGERYGEVVHPEDASMMKQMIHAALENHGMLGVEYRIVAKNGELRWIHLNGCRVDDQDGEVVYLCILTDITKRKKLEQQSEDNLRRSKYLLQYMKETEWTYTIEDKTMHRSGYLEGTYSSEKTVENLLEEERLKPLIHPEDYPALFEAFNERINHIGQSKGVYRVKDSKGDYCHAEIGMISVNQTGEGKPDRIYGETRRVDDVSYIPAPEEQAADSLVAAAVSPADQALEMARTAQARNDDAITGTMAYSLFFQKLEDILRKEEDGKKYAMVCCDINGFQKAIYHYGISVANEMLKLLSEKIRENLAWNDMCSRINGDYFVALVRNDDQGEMMKGISAFVSSLSELKNKIDYTTHGCTVGVYLIQQEDKNIDEMMQRADLARRSIKGMKGNHYAIYTDDLRKGQFIEEEIIQDISAAMRNHTIEICYLPRIRGTKEQVMGCKAVPTIQLKDGNYLPLEDLKRFIDRSPEVQQMVFYVLDTVCTNQGVWKKNGKEIMPISLDITAGQVCMQNAVNRIDEIVRKNGLEPQDILFEIQEPYFRETTVSFRMALHDLHERGYRIVISRFSSDHISINSMRRLPIHAIKFHGEYFHSDINNQKDKIIFKKIVEMAKELGMEASCGGIHTKRQEEFAREIGCDIFEGDMYYGAVRSDVYEKCFLNS